MIIELAIVGGGPAGAAAAIEARRHGLTVAVFDRGRFPRDKVCGEFISGESASLLHRLIPDESARGIRIHTSAFISPRGANRIFPLPQPALGLSRRLLDDALWRTAERSGACCRQGIAVRKLRRPAPMNGHGAFWEIETAGDLRIASRRLILACGRWWAMEGMDSPARASTASHWVGLKAHFRGIALSDRIEMFYFPGGYCGLAPVEDGSANVCCLVHRDLLKGPGAGRGVRDFRRWLERVAASPALNSRLRGAEQITPTVAAAPIHIARRASAADGAILAGDASGFIDPFTGDGISIALHSGTLAARLIARSIEHESNPSAQCDAPREYSMQMRRAVARSHSVAGILRQFVRAPAFAQELAALALPLAGPALARATRWAGM